MTINFSQTAAFIWSVADLLRGDFRQRLAISLMQERRTALISAAVTGKIDVRNWQPPQSEISMEASV